jgi:hypothetical protein
MDKHEQIEQAIAAFTTWERPWEFRGRVLQSPLLDAHGRAVFEKLWSLAARSPAWQTFTDLAVAGDAVRVRLGVADPALSPEALYCIVRAASYEWR